MELRDYWRTIKRRWMTIVACLLVTVAVAGVVTWQTTPQYASTARLFVSTSPSDASQAYQGGLFATQRVASYADLIQSQQLAEQVSQDLGGEPTAAELPGKVEAAVVPETVNLEITATDPDPVLARDIAQAYAEQLSALVADLETPSGSKKAPIKASIVDDAQIPSSPVSPQPVRNLALAALLGLLLGIAAAVVRDLLDTSVSSADDIGEVTEAPIVGSIFTDSSAVGRAPAEVLDTPTPWAEAFRVLRTNMQYVQVDSDDKLVVMTSSLPGEGKTTTAINLAVTLALAGSRVALIECDLRRPLVANRLRLDAAVGTTSVLVGRIALHDALQDYQRTGLKVLTSGPIPPNPSELLQSHAMEKLLGDLRTDFDTVIIDAPPLLPVTDAALLAAQTDGAIVVVKHGKTTRDQLSHAIERLDNVDAATLGVVVNQTPTKRASSGYGYGYGYAPKPDGTVNDASDRKRRGGRRPGRRSQR